MLKYFIAASVVLVLSASWIFLFKLIVACTIDQSNFLCY